MALHASMSVGERGAGWRGPAASSLARPCPVRVPSDAARRPEPIEARRQAEEFYKRWSASQRRKSDILVHMERFENSPTTHSLLAVRHAVLRVRSCLRPLRNRTNVEMELWAPLRRIVRYAYPTPMLSSYQPEGINQTLAPNRDFSMGYGRFNKKIRSHLRLCAECLKGFFLSFSSPRAWHGASSMRRFAKV
jgi:hypothetical protein